MSTSLNEGFANTFLQAAKNGVPIISMGPDPNNMLSIHHAGIMAGDDMNKLHLVVEKLLNDKTNYEQFSQFSREYVLKFNDKEKICEQFYSVLHNLK